MNSNDKHIARSRVVEDTNGRVAQITIDGKGISVYEARGLARREGARLLGTSDVRVQNDGWSDGSFGFYSVRPY